MQESESAYHCIQFRANVESHPLSQYSISIYNYYKYNIIILIIIILMYIIIYNAI